MSIFFHLTELRAQHSELSFVAQRLRAKKNETYSLIIFLEACTEQVCHPFWNDTYTLLLSQFFFQQRFALGQGFLKSKIFSLE